jgi:hypothetical protein
MAKQKQLPKRRKFAQSGHPACNDHLFSLNVRPFNEGGREAVNRDEELIIFFFHISTLPLAIKTILMCLSLFYERYLRPEQKLLTQTVKKFLE